MQGAPARGIRYENKVTKKLQEWLTRKELHGELLAGAWFKFLDDFGQGCCQTDILLVQQDKVYIIEAKLTQTINAHVQLRHLYAPVVSAVYKRPVVLVQVCKNLVSKPNNGFINCISDLFAQADGGILSDQIYTWHFMGEETFGNWK